VLFSLQPGWYITIHVIGVPKNFIMARRSYQPLVLFGLLPYEQKMSVLNFVIRRPNVSRLDQNIIKSKEKLIFHCGYRRYNACPIFSQHSNGTKHKVSIFTFKVLGLAQYCTTQVSYHFAVGEIVPDIDLIVCTSEMISITIYALN
jgi:hypothetical protein